MTVDPVVKELEARRKKLRISRALCAKLIKVPELSFFRWSCGLHQPSPYYKREIEKLLKFIKEIEQNIDGGKANEQ